MRASLAAFNLNCFSLLGARARQSFSGHAHFAPGRRLAPTHRGDTQAGGRRHTHAHTLDASVCTRPMVSARDGPTGSPARIAAAPPRASACLSRHLARANGTNSQHWSRRQLPVEFIKRPRSPGDDWRAPIMTVGSRALLVWPSRRAR